MNRIDILFSTGMFNRTEVKIHFVNPCCFGEDLAQWLVDRLATAGIEASAVGQEDWGWYFNVGKYFVGVGSDASGTEVETSNFGEWRLMIEKRRTLSELLGRKSISKSDQLVSAIQAILNSESAFSNVRFE